MEVIDWRLVVITVVCLLKIGDSHTLGDSTKLSKPKPQDSKVENYRGSNRSVSLDNSYESINSTTITPSTSDHVVEKEKARENRDVMGVPEGRQLPKRLRHQEDPVSKWRNDIRLSFRTAGIEDILDKNQPAARNIHDNPLSQFGLKTSPKSRRRIHPRALQFTRLDELKGAWCQMDKTKIKVRARGCRPKEITSHFCYGQCTSIYIPQYDSGGRLVKQYLSCGFCQTTQWRYEMVRLLCPGRNNMIKVKKVSIPTQCSCSDVYNKVN